MDPRTRRRVLVGVIVALVLAVVPIVAGGFGVRSSTGCDWCHAMEPYAEAHADTLHAGIGCASCHATGGLTTVPAEGLRAVGWALAAATGRSPLPADVSDNPCRDCHDETLTETTAWRGIAVRHADFADQPCAYCHSGTAHAVESRTYRLPEMDDCMGCHKGAADDPSRCSICHVGDAERREGVTSWRSTHGEGWETTHGMGDLDSCSACHAPRYCVDCHGVRVPHPVDWAAYHGASALGEAGEGCLTCHEQGWCSSCHGIDMPHPDTFLPEHGPLSDAMGEERCLRCHAEVACDICHFASSHPDLPGVGMGHGEVTR